jgi:hypothetical protein
VKPLPLPEVCKPVKPLPPPKVCTPVNACEPVDAHKHVVHGSALPCRSGTSRSRIILFATGNNRNESIGFFRTYYSGSYHIYWKPIACLRNHYTIPCVF